MSVQMPGVDAFDAAHPRIEGQPGMQLAVAHVHPGDAGRAMLQQAVGKAAGGLPHVQAAPALHGQPGSGQRTLQLESATRDVACLGRVLQLQLGLRRQFVAAFAHRLPVAAGQAPVHASGNQPLRLAAAGGQAAGNKGLIGTHTKKL